MHRRNLAASSGQAVYYKLEKKFTPPIRYLYGQNQNMLILIPYLCFYLAIRFQHGFYTDSVMRWDYMNKTARWKNTPINFFRYDKLFSLCFTMIDPCTGTPETLVVDIPFHGIQYSLLLSKKKNRLAHITWFDIYSPEHATHPWTFCVWTPQAEI